MGERKVSVGHFEATDDMRDLARSVLDTGRVSYGPLCRKLESDFAEIHGTKHAVVSASGTDSLRAGLHALKIKRGWPDGAGVIVPATTFVATVNIVTQVGLRPILVDVEPDYYCIDVGTTVSEAWVKAFDPVAIIPVNLLGQAADLSMVAEISEYYRLDVMEDSAEAMFVNHKGRPVGSWGSVAGFSFYMAHLITAGVGGIATTNDDELATIMRSLLNHGREPSYISIDDDDGLGGSELAKMIGSRFLFLHPGYSSRMTELQAALALPQLDSWESMLASRRAVASKLTAGLSKHADRLQLPAEREPGEHSYMMYGIKLRGGESKLPLVIHLERNGIETRDILPLVNQPIFRQWHSGDPRNDFPISWDLYETGFYIGCHQGMDDEDIAHVCSVVDDFFEGKR